MNGATVRGLDHLRLAIPPAGEGPARAFYSELLGLAELPKPAELVSRGGVWFALGTQALHLGVETLLVPACKAHPAFAVKDLEACQAHLQRSNVETVPDTTLAHVRRFYTADPFGNRLEFVQAGDRI